MRMADEVKALFPGRHFGAPATEADLCRAEVALGEPLPPVLRELYLAFDGFRGPTDAAFLWPLFAPEGLVEMNQFYRDDDLFPQDLISRCVFFGDNGCGPQWGIVRDRPDAVIEWDAGWGAEFRAAGATPLDAWRAAKRMYDSLDAEG